MNIYLDAKDLINVFQHGVPCAVDQLDRALRDGSHRLVLSIYSITEIAAPLCEPTAKTNVMSMLNQLEKLPIVFIRSDIDYRELREAVNAFAEDRECSDIHPFVSRFDEAVDFHASPATKQFLTYSLAETVWDLYCHKALYGLEAYASEMKARINADRSLCKPPTLRDNFIKMIERNLSLLNVSCQAESLPIFANWVYSKPFRCPSIRLAYEVWHKVVKNRTDALEDSDMEDFQHLSYLPYVDSISLDRRMRGYVEQAAATLGVDYGKRLFKSAQEVISHL